MSLRVSSLLCALALAVPAASVLSSTAFAKDDAPLPPVKQGIRGQMEPANDNPDVPWFGWVWVDPEKDLAPDAVEHAEVSKILYINRCVGGCVIQPGPNDARNNTSTITGNQTSQLTEFEYDDQTWNDTVDCIRDVYSPYDVEIVTEDPGAGVFHHEAILAGDPSEINLDGNIGGIAPSSCEPLNNVISFSFANSRAMNNGDVLTMCWTVAQESAHSFGLPNHVFNCLDPMTYLDGCGKKYFRNQAFACGEIQPTACNCSGSGQNSHVELSAVFGPGTLPPPPELEILAPQEGTSVTDGFSIYWDSQDPRLVASNELWINGTKYATVPGFEYEKRFDTYQLTAPSLPDGIIDVEIRSKNEIGSESIQKVTVTKGAACTSADSCFEFQSCNEGRCEYPPADAELGDSCDVTPNCLEGVCGAIGGDKACTVSCNPNVEGGCVDGFKCREGDEGGFVCWPKGETGGCCSVAGTKRDPLPWFGAGLFFVGIMLLRRRRYN